MVSKKYKLLAALCCMIATSLFAQNSGYSTYDSIYIPAKSMQQYTDFKNNVSDFPPKPKSQWEIGIKTGLLNEASDIATVLFTAPNFGIHIRKDLGYVFGIRLEYLNGVAKGLNWKSSTGWRKNNAWNQAGLYAANTPVFYNYKTKISDLSLEGIVTLNNILFHKPSTRTVLYGIFGIGATKYDAMVDAKNGSSAYNFSSITANNYTNRKATVKALKALLDGDYETHAETHQPNTTGIIGQYEPNQIRNKMEASYTVGFGVGFKISKGINLALENRHSFVKTDLLDGQRWQEHASGDPVLTRDYDSYNFFSAGLNFNLGKNRVEPLHWLNPLALAFNKMNNPPKQKITLPDSDGDGVTDQFDMEQTPAGCPVDAHGVSRDTDGDGVPDCKDKEIITPTQCQPVDADGVGKCPDPECCKNKDKEKPSCASSLGSLPSVSFKSGSVNVSDDAKAALASVASRLRNSPECKVVVSGYCASSKKEQQISWDRVNKVINYLVEKEGISADRFIFNYGQPGGDCNTVDFRGANAGEDGPNSVPAPHPNLRK